MSAAAEIARRDSKQARASCLAGCTLDHEYLLLEGERLLLTRTPGLDASAKLFRHRYAGAAPPALCKPTWMRPPPPEPGAHGETDASYGFLLHSKTRQSLLDLEAQTILVEGLQGGNQRGEASPFHVLGTAERPRRVKWHREQLEPPWLLEDCSDSCGARASGPAGSRRNRGPAQGGLGGAPALGPAGCWHAGHPAAPPGLAVWPAGRLRSPAWLPDFAFVPTCLWSVARTPACLR